MTLTASLLLDLVLLVILVLFFVQGIRRGFVLTLCSLLAVILALIGGWYLAQHYAQPVQAALEPMILDRTSLTNPWLRKFSLRWMKPRRLCRTPS